MISSMENRSCIQNFNRIALSAQFVFNRGKNYNLPQNRTFFTTILETWEKARCNKTMGTAGKIFSMEVV